MTAPDEVERDAVEQNQRLGEALVEIGMVCGLPCPRPGATWGAPEVLARVRDMRAVLDEVNAAAPGMVVDGDILRDLICDAVPSLLSDDVARDIAQRALDGAVRAGMTVLHGREHKPRVVAPGAGQDQTTKENR